MTALVTTLWFATEAEEAAEFYCSVLPNSRVVAVHRAPIDTPGAKAGQVLTVDFELDGRPFVGLNGGSPGEYTEAVSVEIRCADQQEVDRIWDGLLAGGGRPVQCGWLVDRYGMRWQVVPEAFYTLWQSGDTDSAARAFAAMTEMIKLDIAELERAARG